MSITKIKVRYAETDAMGIVHHANYYLYFEVAREDLIKELGISYKDLESLGIMMPLVETQCKYVSAAKYDDSLNVEAKIKELSPAKVVIEYKITTEEDNRIVAKGKTTQTFVHSTTFKIVNLRRFNNEIWNMLNSNFENNL